jgi:type III secretory pathway component EscV
MDKKVITIGSQTYVLKFDEFDEDVDVDSLLKIDYSNLIGEMITFPVIVNRFGQLLAEAENQVALAKLNLEVTEAKLKESLRIKLADRNGKAPSVDAVNTAVLLEKGYQAMRRSYLEKQKTRDYMNSIFWSAKDKSEKLDKLSLTVQQGDIADSVIEGRVNNVLIKRTKKLIGD